ncbi:protein kinase [Thermobifida halotolerans]|uniref:Protein kinase n=1 Tax=Thermobifida halotolerans TaxID=483545 RepID=A0A399G396_9ACTN|nr:serine/threonine-protein kinase [Thermobifida halotolerans]UOE19493.1 protein kinase [Thermobifida halotolerans]
MPSDGLPKNLEPLAAGDPATIGPYVLVGRLGSGGMGTVYLGRAPEKGTHVAIKVIRPELAFDEATRARFRDEMENARRVASFCTAKVLDHGTFENRPYMVTEYIAGTALAEHIAEHGPLDSGTLHGFALGVAAALAAIHKAGLVHRDLKPANVLLSLSGPRVIDFGIARALNTSTSHTQTGIVMGSPGWMAPEQLLEEKVTTKADIFAWGCLVAFAGNGRHPFGNGDAMTLGKRMLFAEPDIGGLDAPLDRLVARALAKDPDQRPSAQELLLELAGGAANNDANDMVSHALHQSWRPNLPPVPPGYPPPGAHQAHTGMRPPQTAVVPQPYPQQGAPGPMPSHPPAGAQGPPQNSPMPQRQGPPGPHHTGQFPAVPPNTGGGGQPPGAPPQQSATGGVQARPYVPPNPLPPHRPMRPDGRPARLVVALVVVGAVLLAVLLGMVAVSFVNGFPFGGSDSQGEQGQDAPAAPEESKEDPPGRSESDGGLKSDGVLESRVLETECSDSAGGRRIINGPFEYCVFRIEVRNVSSVPLEFSPELQTLDLGGEEIEAEPPRSEELLDPLWDGPIGQGETVEGRLVFLVPIAGEPQSLTLRGSRDSHGMTFGLDNGQPV